MSRPSTKSTKVNIHLGSSHLTFGLDRPVFNFNPGQQSLPLEYGQPVSTFSSG